MATTTEIEPQSPVLVPPAPPKRAHRATGKRPTGRPAPEPDPDDDDEEDQLAADAEEVEDWQLHCQNITQDDWGSQILLYLKRISPTTEKRSSGRSIDTASYARPITLDDIKKEHGSGVYRLRFLRMTQPSGKFRKYRDYFIDVVDAKYPPNLPYGEWIDRPENEAWKWAGPALLAKQQEEAARVGAPMPIINGAGGAYPPGLNFNELLLRVTEANDPKKLVEFFKTMSPPPDTTTAVILGKLLDASLNAKPAAAPDNSSTNKLLEMLLEDRKQDRIEMASLRDKLLTPAPQKSIIEQFVELRPQIKELVDAFATKAGKTDIWAELAKEGIGQIPDLISLGRDFIKKSPEPQQNGYQARGIAAAPTNGAPAAVSEPPATKPVSEMTEAEKQANIDHLWKKWARRLLDISTKLIEEFTIQDQGYSFRDWYVEMYGKLNWAELRRDLANVDDQGVPHPELITNMYFAHEQLRKALSPPEKLTAFLVETFTNFGEEKDVTVEDPEDGVEPTEVIPAGKQSEAKTK